ncbi:MAG: hypothetical protein K0R57_4693 [Paenibacillaceae bacterium]|jgi:hypothetical protein|nr:hypothetical protein [Paenibacillaceae bacterium]
MWSRIIAIGAFVVVLIAAGIFFQFEDDISSRLARKQASAADAQHLEEEYNRQWHEEEQRVENRLTFHKKMTVVHVGELNSHLYLGRGYGNQGEYGVTMNPKTQSLYFAEEQLVPAPNDNLLLIHDVNSLDVFIKQSIYKSARELNFRLESIQHQNSDDQAYHNECRLFNNQVMKVTAAGDSGAIRVEFDSQIKELLPGEKAVFDKTSDESGSMVRSKIVITNYGLWETINMKYVVNS